MTEPTPVVEGTFYRGLAAGAMLSWPIWLLLYLVWRWIA